MKQETIGFSPKNEERFLKRLPGEIRRINLDRELMTQLEEDFGMVQFTLEYSFNDQGRLCDIKSGQEIVELTARGEREEEIESIKKIEQGLKEDSTSTWISFSPKNEEYNYPSNCVDFWRVVGDGRVVWNRIVVKEDFEGMNRIRFLLGQSEVKDEFEMLASPIKSSGLKLSELFDLFSLSEVKNSCSLELIENIVSEYVEKFEDEFDKEIVTNPNIIFRLYSACYKAIKENEYNGRLLDRSELCSYMFGQMNRTVEVNSSGCSVTTKVGEFGEKIGYYITSNGEVKFGEIPKDYKECKKCGCWYQGEKCPFC